MKPAIFLFALCALCVTMGAKAQMVAPPPISPTVWPDAPWDKITDKLKKELSLDKQQKQGVKEAYKNYYTEVDRYMTSETNTEETPKNPKSRELSDDYLMDNPAINKLVAKRNARIKQLITPEQYQKYVPLAKSYDQMPYVSHGPVYQ